MKTPSPLSTTHLSPMVLVTGGLGYIGSHTIVELVQAGFDPVIIDNLSGAPLSVLSRLEKITEKSLTFYEGDVRDYSFLKDVFSRHSFSAVLHFAALKDVNESSLKPLEYYETNVLGGINVLRAAHAYGVPRFIFSSSAAVYGDPKKNPISEFEDTHPKTPYGTTKLMFEKILEDHCKANPGLAGVSLRYFNPIGAHSSGLIGEISPANPNNLMPLLCRVAKGINSELLVYGTDYDTKDGSCIRDFVHVVDLARGHVQALNWAFEQAINQSETSIETAKQTSIQPSQSASGTAKAPAARAATATATATATTTATATATATAENYLTCNLGSGTGFSILEIIKCFEQANDLKISFSSSARRPGDIPVAVANTDRAEELLGWKAKFNLTQMCQDSWAWARANRGGY